MIFKANKLAELAEKSKAGEGNAFSITPQPNYADLSKTGEASVELRLGRWFVSLRQSRTSMLDLGKEDGGTSDEVLSKKHFVPFGESFILHPGRFVLGATLEWVTLPSFMAGYVTGKSSLGRRGLIIETAAGVHPGFSGCLTLEFANVGEVPLAITPGMKVCQVFFHEASESPDITHSKFSGRRRPTMGLIKKDDVLEKLKRPI